MDGFPTPNFFQDGFTDETRPHMTQGTFFNTSGQPIVCSYHLGHRRWYSTAAGAQANRPTPAIQVQNSSPIASPSAGYTMPSSNFAFGGTASAGLNASYLSMASVTQIQPQVSQPAASYFPNRLSVGPAQGVYSARMYLESDVPGIQIHHSGSARQSSTLNPMYANINQLVPWNLPQGLCGYESLSDDRIFVPVQPDPCLRITTEEDAIWACRMYIMTPVDI